MPTPRWRAIADDLRTRIDRAEWAPGEQLPSQRALAQHYGTRSLSTISRATGALVAEGVLRTDPAAPRGGMRVRTRHLFRRDLAGDLRVEYQRVVEGQETAEGLFETATGSEDAEVGITYEHNVTDPDMAALLDLPADTALLRRTFRYWIAGGEPHQVAWSYLPETTAAAAGMVNQTSEVKGRGTIAQLADAGITTDRVEILIEARIPTTPEVAELAIPAGVPVVVQRRTIYAADGSPAAVQHGVVPGDRIAYTLTVPLARADR